MARPKKKPLYDSNKIMQELLEAVSESYSEKGELKLTAEEFDMSALKIRKLLTTAGVYSSAISDEINELYKMNIGACHHEQFVNFCLWY